MPRLPNTRWEIYARALAQGKSATQSYVLAGYKRNDGNAIRLKGNEQIQARLAELLDDATEGNRPDSAKALKELGRIAFSDIRKVVRWRDAVFEAPTPQNDSSELLTETILKSNAEVKVIDSDKIDADTAAAIPEVTQARDGSIRVKMHAKLPALIKLLDYYRTNETNEPVSSEQSPSEQRVDFKAAVERYRVN